MDYVRVFWQWKLYLEYVLYVKKNDRCRILLTIIVMLLQLEM